VNQATERVREQLPGWAAGNDPTKCASGIYVELWLESIAKGLTMILAPGFSSNSKGQSQLVFHAKQDLMRMIQLFFSL